MPQHSAIPMPRQLATLGALALACAGDPAASTPGTGSTGASSSSTGALVDPSSTDPDSTGAMSSSAADSTGAPIEPPTLESVHPNIVDPLGGSTIAIRGAHLLGTDRVWIGDVEATIVAIVDDSELRARTSPIAPGPGLDVTIHRDGLEATLPGVLESWSPAEFPGARLFDAAQGVQTEEAVTTYAWHRLTANIGDDWRVRDGNTTTWLPATQRYWMVAGWNGLQEPEGFSMVPPDTVYPPQNTTDEVWSSPDGVTWTLELPHGHGQFERRHSQNTVVWLDRLWMIGGDTHQGYYNHDVVSSADGMQWDVVLGPGTTEPPWSERALQAIGVYDDKLWLFGGQDLLGPPDAYVHHNDVWNTDDGEHWTLVAADGPASATRPAGCGVLDGLVEFQGALWLVGCARDREDAVGHWMSNEVWSTTDGVTWTLHAEPPWTGKIWPNVVVWDDRLWILFGYTYGDPANGWTAGNANEVWYSDDGETWRSLPVDSPQPGSHAQGIAVTDDALLYAGGNYSFGFGDGVDKSAWRLVPHRGEAVRAWIDRGADGRTVTAQLDDARPNRVEDGLGDGIPGLVFDGSNSVLQLDAPDEQAKGRSVFWVARAPFVPRPWGWIETFDPVGTIVGGPGAAGVPVSSVGLSDGQVVAMNLEPEPGAAGELVYTRIAAGDGLQEAEGAVRFAGMTHATDGAMQAWVDGEAIATTGAAGYGTPRLWSRIGGGSDGSYYGANSRFAGTLGAVIVLPSVADDEGVARMHAWAQGRFGAR